ncbi:MAG: hypothetical protein EBR30_28865 [Cytophagia bacterium]|nr:hypothetical protein [Cytophagia bacterium]
MHENNSFINTLDLTNFVMKYSLLIGIIVSQLTCYSQVARQAVCFKGTSDSNVFDYPKEALSNTAFDGDWRGIFYGETHTLYFEVGLKYQLITHLNSQFGVRDVFMEIGYSAAFLYNQYLETGDTALLINPRLPYSLPVSNHRILWKRLYEYNKTLPTNLKLRIHGVDFERTEACKALLLLKPVENDIPKELQEVFSEVEELASSKGLQWNSMGFRKKFESICKALRSNDSETRKLFGDNYPIVKSIIENSKFSGFTKVRDDRMFNGMERIIQDYKIEKFVGMFGGDHTTLESSTALPTQFLKKAEYQGKIVTISSIYRNTHNPFTHTDINFLGPTSNGLKETTEIFEKYLTKECRAILIPTTKMDTPLNSIADYLLLVNDSQPVK